MAAVPTNVAAPVAFDADAGGAASTSAKPVTRIILPSVLFLFMLSPLIEAAAFRIKR
jgi:hypothetical protein